MNDVKTVKELKIKVEDIERVYVGKPRTCMCGCAGKYYSTSTKYVEDYVKDKEKEVDMKKVLRVFNKVKKNASEGIEVINDYIYTLVLGKKQYSIYCEEVKQ